METRKSKKNSGKHPGKSKWPVAYRWAAMGTLVMYTAVGTTTVAVAEAQQAGTAQPAADPARSLTVRRFDIPAGPLSEVLNAFQAASGLRVLIRQEAIPTLNSPGVSGLYTVDQALQKMLAGTQVTYRFGAPGTVTVELASVSTSIEVRESAPPLSSPKYTEPLRDVPQSIMVIPKSVMEEQGATTLRDVLRNVPGLTVSAGEGGAPAGDNLTLRGFSARNDLFVDGVRDLGVQSRDPFNLEQIEVTKGPTSVVSGRGSTGGTINMVSKLPNLNRYFSGQVNLATDDTRRFVGDINLPLERIGLGERTALRLNLLKHESGVAGRDVVENDRWGFAPTLAFGLNTPTRVTLSYFKLKQDNISDYGIPWVPATNNVLVEYRDRPAPVPRNTFYGFKDRDYERNNSDTATVRVEHDFSDSLVFRNQFRFGRTSRDSNATPPRFASPDSTDINRELRAWLATDKIFDNQTDLRASFSTGGIQHSVVMGANFSSENNVRRTRTGANSPTTMLNPNPNDIYTLPITIGPNTGDITGKTQAFYAFDTMKFGQHFEATGGLRWERFDVDGITTAAVPTARVDKMTSGRAALVYKPVEPGSFYVSYGTSLNPSLEGLSYGTANTSIPPEKTYTVEAGTKWDVAHNRLMLSGAVFRVDKDNARTPGILPDDPPQVLDGRQRVNGFELGATGSITRNLKLFGAYTYLDSRIARSNNPAEVGNYFQNTPKNSYSVWTTYYFKKFMVGGGPRFVGKRYGNNTNTRFVDSYWTMDLMASYAITNHVDLRFNLYNANDAYYFDRLGGGHLIPGAARSAMVSTSFHF